MVPDLLLIFHNFPELLHPWKVICRIFATKGNAVIFCLLPGISGVRPSASPNRRKNVIICRMQIQFGGPTRHTFNTRRFAGLWRPRP
jgi:hypothetical protein